MSEFMYYVNLTTSAIKHMRIPKTYPAILRDRLGVAPDRPVLLRMHLGRLCFSNADAALIRRGGSSRRWFVLPSCDLRLRSYEFVYSSRGDLCVLVLSDISSPRVAAL